MTAFPALVAFALVTLACVVTPLLVAAWRRAQSERASTFALRLQIYARDLRRAQCEKKPLDDDMLAIAAVAKIPEFAPFAHAAATGRLSGEQLADAADRLALRVRRRIAFNRKMLARTASGRRRGALAAIFPLATLLVGWVIDGNPWRDFLDGGALQHMLIALTFLQALGGTLSWRLAHVEI